MNVLAIGIHPDDVELGCGGTVILAATRGHNVTLIDMSEGSASTNGTVDDRRGEAADAAVVMGVRDRQNLGLPDTGIRSEDPDQTRKMVGAIRQHRPDLVLAPSADDPHPDHASGGELVARAVYLAGLAGFQPDNEPHESKVTLVYGGRLEVAPQIVIDITSVHETKMRAIVAHASQFVRGPGTKPTRLNDPGFLIAVEGRDRLYGQKIRTSFGEAFRSLGPLAISDLSILEG